MAVKRRIVGSVQDGTPVATAGGEGGDGAGAIAGSDAPPPVSQSSPDFWTSERELELMESLMLHKPAGTSKHFQMALILHRLSSNPDFKNMKASVVWSHLDTLYNMEAADGVEACASDAVIAAAAAEDDPSEGADFSLPLKDFYSALAEMKRTSGIQIPDANVYFGSEKAASRGDDAGTPSGTKRPKRNSTPNSTPSSSKRRKVT